METPKPSYTAGQGPCWNACHIHQHLARAKSKLRGTPAPLARSARTPPTWGAGTTGHASGWGWPCPQQLSGGSEAMQGHHPQGRACGWKWTPGPLLPDHRALVSLHARL